jgi:ABC-type nitrate/sulfonate/bicarbonate transport system permease component
MTVPTALHAECFSVLTVVCEMLVGVNGLGSWTLISAKAFRSADLYTEVILLGFIGYIGSLLISLLSDRILMWKLRSPVVCRPF